MLAVHPSNYRVEGFATRPALAELATLAHEHALGLVHDVGSGLLAGELGDEPSVQASLHAGADLVLFSGDKLLGGPQAGLVVGRAEPVGRLARYPLARAVRADKLTLAALEATLADHLAGRRDQLPVWRSLLLTVAELEPRAAAVAGEGLESILVEVDPAPAGATEVLARLRAGDPPVVARVERDRVVVDLRTVPPEQDALVARALAAALPASP